MKGCKQGFCIDAAKFSLGRTFSSVHAFTFPILSINIHNKGLAPALTACRHTVSGSISLPSRGPFHLSLTVLLRYQSPNVFSLTGWSPRIHPGFHVSRATRDPATKPNLFQLRDFHPLRSNFPELFVYKFDPDVAVPLPRPSGRFRLFPVRSPLLRESLLLSLPGATKMFQFTPFASGIYSTLTRPNRYIPAKPPSRPEKGGSSRHSDPSPQTHNRCRMTGLQPAGLPHSEIPGSKLAYSFPRLIAVRHVLRRHSVRRHPPCALCAFTFKYPCVLYSLSPRIHSI